MANGREVWLFERIKFRNQRKCKKKENLLSNKVKRIVTISFAIANEEHSAFFVLFSFQLPSLNCRNVDTEYHAFQVKIVISHLQLLKTKKCVRLNLDYFTCSSNTKICLNICIHFDSNILAFSVLTYIWFYI